MLKGGIGVDGEDCEYGMRLWKMEQIDVHWVCVE